MDWSRDLSTISEAASWNTRQECPFLLLDLRLITRGISKQKAAKGGGGVPLHFPYLVLAWMTQPLKVTGFGFHRFAWLPDANRIVWLTWGGLVENSPGNLSNLPKTTRIHTPGNEKIAGKAPTPEGVSLMSRGKWYPWPWYGSSSRVSNTMQTLNASERRIKAAILWNQSTTLLRIPKSFQELKI